MSYKPITAFVLGAIAINALYRADKKQDATDLQALEQRFHNAPVQIALVESAHDELVRRGFDEHTALYGVALRDMTCRNVNQVVNELHREIVQKQCDSNSSVPQFPMHKGQYKIADLYAKDFPKKSE
jgi:hypothetical protein